MTTGVVMKKEQSKGLQDIVAGQTEICSVGTQGDDLRYRGYSIDDFVRDGCFEEVAYLLLHKKLPTEHELCKFFEDMDSLRGLSGTLKAALLNLPKETHPMDVLRTGVSIMGCENTNTIQDSMLTAYRLTANLSDIVLTWYLHHNPNHSNYVSKEKSVSGRFLETLRGQPVSKEEIKAFDCSLILYAEHEFNASTFASRVTTATLTDMYSAVCAAIGTLKGPLHGGANEKAMEMLKQFDTENDAVNYINHALENKIKIMGFGHRVYKVKDPRHPYLKAHTKALAQKSGDMKYYNLSETVENTMWEKKKMFPNVDFYGGAFYYYLGIPIPLYTPIFAFSRISGWAAHILEQQSNNRLIRPTAEYIGSPARDYVPMSRRS